MSHKKEIVYSTDEEEEKPVQRIRKPLSEEAKQQLRDRLAKAREAKKAKRQTTPPAVHSEEEPVKRRGRTKKVNEEVEMVEPKKRERKKKEVIIVEPESESDPEPEPVVELTKKNIRKKKEVVIVEPESPPPEPVVEQVKPKRKYIRKPKITIPPAFNPF